MIHDIYMNNYSYLKPPSRAFSTASLESAGTTGTRTIFGGDSNTYTNEEIEAIHRLKEYSKHKNPNKQYKDELLLRYCYLGSFRTAESVEKFKYFEEWESMKEIPPTVSRGILHSGVFYCYGRDETYAPTIYFHPARVDLQKYEIKDYLAALRVLLQPVIDHMLVPGRIEQWNVVMDLRNFNQQRLSNNYEVIYKNMTKICLAYPYRLKRLFIIDRNVSSLWGSKDSGKTLILKMAQQLEVDKKCVMVSKLKQLDEYIRKDERELEYGGELDDLREYWPIPSTNKLMEMNSKFIDKSEMSSECEYQSVQNADNEPFFEEAAQGSTLCDMRRHCSLF